MTIPQIESQLQEYIILEKRIETKLKELQKYDMRDVALSMGPKDIKAVDTEQPSAHTNRREWVDEFLDRFEAMARKKKMVSEELSLCIERQIEIRMMVERAGLDNNQSLYVELRYYKGHSVKEITDIWPNGRSDTWLADIRKSALELIAAKCG